MRITEPDPREIIRDEYDFTFSNGLLMSFSVAKDLGDTVDFDTSPMAVRLHFAAKTSSTNPDTKFPSEDITLLMQHVISIAHRTRAVTLPTKEQQDLFKQVLLPLPKQLQ